MCRYKWPPKLFIIVGVWLADATLRRYLHRTNITQRHVSPHHMRCKIGCLYYYISVQQRASAGPPRATANNKCTSTVESNIFIKIREALSSATLSVKDIPGNIRICNTQCLPPLWHTASPSHCGHVISSAACVFGPQTQSWPRQLTTPFGRVGLHSDAALEPRTIGINGLHFQTLHLRKNEEKQTNAQHAFFSSMYK